VLATSTTAAKEEMLSSFASWCAETCISASEGESQKPHQGFAGQNPVLHRGIEWSKSTLALGLPEWAGKTAISLTLDAGTPRNVPRTCAAPGNTFSEWRKQTHCGSVRHSRCSVRSKLATRARSPHGRASTSGDLARCLLADLASETTATSGHRTDMAILGRSLVFTGALIFEMYAASFSAPGD
jgi:hypothetical protein